MARFDRKVERTKKSFEFTQKEKIVETNQDVFKKNFTFKHKLHKKCNTVF